MSVLSILKPFLADKQGRGWEIKSPDGKYVFICSEEDRECFECMKDTDYAGYLYEEDGCLVYEIGRGEFNNHVLDFGDKLWYVTMELLNTPIKIWTEEWVAEQEKKCWK